jgi:DNA modification methylase
MQPQSGELCAKVSVHRSEFEKFVNTVMLGDCCSVMQQLPDYSIDLVLTDPPYLINYQSRDGRNIAGDVNDGWLIPAFTEAYRVFKRGGFCISFYGWSKGSAFLQYRHEQAYFLAKGRVNCPLFPVSDVLFWKYTGNRLHPTQKPVRVLTRLIRAFSQPSDVVLDPFCGSGSVPLAAKLTGRRYIGIELRQDYCEVAQRRLNRSW